MDDSMKQQDRVQPILEYLNREFAHQADWVDDFDRGATTFRIPNPAGSGYLLLKIDDDFVVDNYGSLDAQLLRMNLADELRKTGSAKTLIMLADGKLIRRSR
jgi:hypothetical protein